MTSDSAAFEKISVSVSDEERGGGGNISIGLKY